MSKRKISECMSIRINVGNYQHIELTKYAEEEIDYSTTSEREDKEDALRDDLINSLVRSMNEVPKRLGKGVEAAQEVEEAIVKAVPEWLKNNPVPNIANGAGKTNVCNSAEQKANKDANTSNTSDLILEDPKAVEPTKIVETVADEDLFEDEQMSEVKKVDTKVEEVEDTKVEEVEDTKVEETKKTDDDNLESISIFDDDDDDLFGDN